MFIFRSFPFTSRYLFIALCLFPIGDVKMGSYGEPLRVGSQRRVILPARMLKAIDAKEGDIIIVTVQKAKVLPEGDVERNQEVTGND